MRISISISYKDLYGKGFLDFLKQYKKQTGHNYYVQFTNYKDNILDKNHQNDTDHNDPSGVYGYPLQYVTKYPGDIWYGQNCKYLRVLRAIDGEHCLFVQDLNTDHAAIGFVNKFTPSRAAYEQLACAKKYIKQNYNENGRLNAKAAFLCLQAKFERDEGDKTISIERRSSSEQNSLLRKIGYTSVCDTAKSHKTAVINDREPEQIIFLSRKSFTIENVFYVGKGNGSIVVQQDDKTLSKKLAALIFVAMNDKLQSFERTYNTFWSKGGFCAHIEFLRNVDDNLKMGQKRHRATKTGNLKYVMIKIECDAGTMEYKFDDEEFAYIAHTIGDDYHKRTKKTNFVPLSKAKSEADKEAAKRQQIEEYRNKMYESADEWFEIIEPLYNKVAAHYNQPLLPTDNYNNNDHYDTLIILCHALEDCKSDNETVATKAYYSNHKHITDQFFTLCGFLTQFYYEHWFNIEGGDYDHKFYKLSECLKNIVESFEE